MIQHRFRTLCLLFLCPLIALAATSCGATRPAARVQIERIVLLTPEAQMSANVTPEQLATFIRAAQAQIEQTVAGDHQAMQLIAQFTLQPGAAHIVQITHAEGADTAQIRRLVAALRLIQPLYPRQEPVLFQVKFAVRAS